MRPSECCSWRCCLCCCGVLACTAGAGISWLLAREWTASGPQVDDHDNVDPTQMLPQTAVL
jgi:hypothetical protein